MQKKSEESTARNQRGRLSMQKEVNNSGAKCANAGLQQVFLTSFHNRYSHYCKDKEHCCDWANPRKLGLTRSSLSLL